MGALKGKIRAMKAIGKKRKRLIAAALILLAVIAVDFFATELVYEGIFARYDEAAECPEDVEAALEAAGCAELSFVSRGSSIAARLYCPEEDGGALILLIPGIHAGMDDYKPVILSLTALGYGVLTFDPAGCRESRGKNAGGFLQTVYDTEACLEFIESNGCFGCERLFLLGHSRGGYAACAALAENDLADGAIVISAPDSAMDAVIGASVHTAGAAAAYANYPMLWFTQALRYGAGNVTRSAAELIDKSGRPALIVQGEDDPYYTETGFSLYSKRGGIHSDKAEYLLVPGGHGDLLFDESGHASQELIDAIDGFISGCVTAGLSG